MSSRGLSVERKVAAYGRTEGYVVASLRHAPGPGDQLWARVNGAGLGSLLYVECKGNAGSPYAHFSKAERAQVARIARQAGAAAYLAHWPPRGALRLIPSWEWPSA